MFKEEDFLFPRVSRDLDRVCSWCICEGWYINSGVKCRATGRRCLSLLDRHYNCAEISRDCAAAGLCLGPQVCDLTGRSPTHNTREPHTPQTYLICSGDTLILRTIDPMFSCCKMKLNKFQSPLGELLSPTKLTIQMCDTINNFNTVVIIRKHNN